MPHLSHVWLDSLAEDNGRLRVPPTGANRCGVLILITRRGARRAVTRPLCATGVIGCVGGSDREAEGKLVAAKSGFASICSRRSPLDEPDEACWLAGDGWWPSTAPLDE